MSRGKKYIETVKKYKAENTYDLNEALGLVKTMAYAKFDETVDLSVKVNLKKNQSVRDTVVLPHQFRGEKKVLVFCKSEKEQEAKDAGAAYVGAEELIEKVKGGWLDFDIAVATPDMMKDVGKLGMVLGRKGLMPNPKTGTVTFDLKSALAELKKGRVEIRAD
jgi:large subunit ribosomal protein L1